MHWIQKPFGWQIPPLLTDILHPSLPSKNYSFSKKQQIFVKNNFLNKIKTGNAFAQDRKESLSPKRGSMPARKRVIFHSNTSILQPPTKIAHYWQLKNLDCQYFLAWVLSAGCRPSWQGGRNLAAGRLSTLLLSGADERPLHCVEKLAGGHGTGLGPQTHSSSSSTTFLNFPPGPQTLPTSSPFVQTSRSFLPKSFSQPGSQSWQKVSSPIVDLWTPVTVRQN